jgi:hypothetical protein
MDQETKNRTEQDMRGGKGGTADLLEKDREHARESEPESKGSTREGTMASQRPGGTQMHDQQLSKSHDDGVPLLDEDRRKGFDARWQECQAGFVDNPRTSVEQADQLVADLMRDLASEFAAERQRLEDQWGRGDRVSTEELRVALQKYRSFFHRLLSV